MKKLTPDFYVHLADHLADSLKGKDLDNIHYIVLSDSNATWQNSLIDPDTTVNSLVYDAKKKIILSKKVMEDDVSRMIRGYIFTPGTVYDMYDTNIDISEKMFFTSVHEGSGALTIWKCLYNNNGLPAKIAPTYSATVAEERYQTTSDGYIWKFMYRVPAFQVNKFKTGNYIPVIENEDVKKNAVSGSIDIIKVEDAGKNYNSYSYGTFKQAQVGGDPLIYSLATAENQNIIQTNLQMAQGQFLIDIEKPIVFGTSSQLVFTGGLATDGSIAMKFAVQSTDGVSFVSVTAPIDLNLPIVTHVYQFNSEADIHENGVIKFENAFAVGTIGSVRYRYTPALSANTDFYKNSTIYIRSGRGAGQVRTVAEYIVAGNERRVMLDKPFDIVPTISSRFEILPRIIIQGDGTGSNGTGQATAIPVIDNSSNSIVGIQIIDPGKNYTYASAMAIANTGFININTGESITSTSAILRPVLPPKGGHGSNVYAELFSNAVCISKEFENTEGGKITVGNDFGQIMLMKGLQTANTVLTTDTTALIFQDDEEIIQTDGKARGYVSFREGNDLRLTKVEGQFTSGSTITTTRATTNIVAEIDTVDRTNDVLNGLTRFSVEVQSTGFNGQGFKPDDVVRQGTADESNWNAEGRVFSANTSFITITMTKGVWNVSDDISGVVATMINVDNGAVAKITGKVDSDIVIGSGTITHIETIAPITREESQNETIRLVISTTDLE